MPNVTTDGLEARLRSDVTALCSDACAGRATGTPGGRAARALVARALAEAGLRVQEQALPRCGGANLLAHVAGSRPRHVLVAAHYDHLGVRGGETYRGADDNAAAVALLLALARSFAVAPPAGRGVVLAAFDAEEPPHFLGASMGSEVYAAAPSVPLDQIDLMICLDLVGHTVGQDEAPEPVGASLFALGAELSEGTGPLVDALAHAEPLVALRRLDAGVVPPLSDYHAFWQRERPFLFLTCGRWRHYHSPRDTPERLDFARLAARARCLEHLTRAACDRPEPSVRFIANGRDDAATLRTLRELGQSLAARSAAAHEVVARVTDLLALCDPHGRLPATHQHLVPRLVASLESNLA